MLQFLPLATIKIQEQQARNAIIHFHLCLQTFLVILVITSSRYCHLQTLCVNFQAKWTTLTFSVKICPKMDLSLEIQNTTVGIFRRANFQATTDNFDFFGTNLRKNGSRDRNFKNQNPDLESAPQGYYVGKFSVKTDNFEFFGLNLRKLTNFVGYFGSYNVEGVVESWVEAETRWSWVEVNGAG